VRVSGPEFSINRQRERLNRLLIAHDLEKPVATIRPADLAMIRQIALEGAITNQEPVLRRHAIFMLAQHPTAENMNALVDLATHGEDYYVRGHALQALGATGFHLAGPILREGLKYSSFFERRAAESGLLRLGQKIGPAALSAVFDGERDEYALQSFKRVLGALVPRKPGARKSNVKRNTTARRPRLR
jgi:hypothetical protein